MHDFGKLVYLDLQKSGSTFVSKFLNETCLLPLVREVKHGRVDWWSYRRHAFYFITVRHPISQYSSLFRYGVDCRGGLYGRLAKAGKAGLYRGDTASFNQWLRFVLDSKNAGVLEEGFERVAGPQNLGLLSFRYLMLSLVRPLKALSRRRASADLLSYVEEKSIVDHVILNERLNDGLLELAKDIKSEYFDQRLVEQFFTRNKRVNASTLDAAEIAKIDDDLVELIREKERVLLQFYPVAHSSRCGPQHED